MTESNEDKIRQKIDSLPKGKVFTENDIEDPNFFIQGIQYHSQDACIERIDKGIYYVPEFDIDIGKLPPKISDVVDKIVEYTGETIQVYGQEALNILGITKKKPPHTIYYSSGPSRELKIGNKTLEFIHTENKRLLQHPGTTVGIALSALWYLGKDNLTPEIVEKIRDKIGRYNFEILIHSQLTDWMMKTVREVIFKDKDFLNPRYSR